MKKGPAIALLLTLALGVGVFLLPHAPEAGETAAVVAPAAGSDDEKVLAAAKGLEDGSIPPMQAILSIREVVDANPDHLLGNYYLGYFAIMSNQLDKATERLEKTLSIDPDYAPAHLLLGDTYAKLGQADKAESHYQEFLQLSDDENMRAEVEGKLNELKSNS